MPTLLAVAGGRDALRAELAVEWLGRRGPAAAAALPLLRTLLERPEPRVLLTPRRLPLHRKVAAAILAIAAPSDAAALARDPTATAIERDGDTAALALDVLAGRRPPPTPAPRAWPARVEQRVAALVVELADPARSAAASANLAALGEPACLPVARLLQPANGAPTIDAALATLRALGPAAGAAAEPLVDALTALPAAHAAAVVDALAAVVPGCGDVVPTLACVGRLSELRVLDRRIVGIDAATATALTRALARLRTIQRVGSELLAAELVIPLTDPDVELRERALVVAAERGAAARPLRPLLAELLQCSRATRHELRWSDDRTIVDAVDRTGHVHRLAARAIVAIVEHGDPLRALAEQVLARPEPR